MRNIIVFIIIAVMIPVVLNTQNGSYEYDPFRGNYTLGKKGEIVSICSYMTNDTCKQSIYSYNAPLQELNSVFSTFESGEKGILGSQEMDIVSGNFNSDIYDDVVAAWEGPDQSVILMIPKIDSITLNWSESYVYKTDTMSLHSQSHSKIRLAVGNFDIDSDDEFVLAYLDRNGKINILLFDTDGTLVPSVRSMIADDSLVTSLGNAARFDIATGEFDGDGVDELVLTGVKPPVNDWRIFCTVYDFNWETNTLINKLDQYGVYRYPQLNNYKMDRLSIVTGDTDGDNLDEIVLGIQMDVASAYYNNFTFNWVCSRVVRSCLQTVEVTKSLDSLKNDHHIIPVWDQGTNWFFFQYPPNPPPDMSIEKLHPIDLICKDFNLDNKEEILYAVKDKVIIYEELTDSTQSQLIEIDQLSYSPKLGNESNQILTAIDLDADTTTICWKPELIINDFPDESTHRLRVYTPVVNDSLILQNFELVSTLEEDFSNVHRYAFAGGDFNGDGIRLGPPKRYSRTDLVQPIVILNAPPIHFDVFNDTIFDVNMSYNENQSLFRATYQTEEGEDKEVQTEINQDWGVSANLSAGGSFLGVGAKASLSASYGEGFSKVEGSTQSVTIRISADAVEDDRIYAIVTDYDIWEYPLYAERQRKGNILVVRPRITENRWFPSKSWSGSRYVPNHEVGNIFSYEAYTNLVDNEEMAQWVTGTYSNDNSFVLDANSSYDWSLNIEKFNESGADKSREIGLEVGASVSGFGVEVGVEANYNESEIQTYRTSVSDFLSVQVHLDAIDMSLGEMGYVVTPYSYWAKNGALVLDYAVRPELSEPGYTPTWWQSRYGNDSDPAFILPWRYDPEKGFTLEVEAKRYQTKEIRFEPENPEPGDEITIYARIHNYSLIPTQEPVIVQFYVGDPDDGGTLIIGKEGQTEISTGSSISSRGKTVVSMDWKIPDDITYYPRIYALIDPHDDILEIHNYNNKGFNVLPVEGIVSVDEITDDRKPDLFSLNQNYPNPFNPSTKIKFSLPKPEIVKIEVYNTLGQKVEIIQNQQMKAGYHEVEFSATNLSSGVYFYRIEAGEFQDVKKMVLIK
jgi:hypothetical protein